VMADLHFVVDKDGQGAGSMARGRDEEAGRHPLPPGREFEALAPGRNR
jgi:hypothetical protein